MALLFDCDGTPEVYVSPSLKDEQKPISCLYRGDPDGLTPIDKIDEVMVPIERMNDGT